MDFSELSKHSGLVCFSPNGEMLASSDQNKVVIRNADSLEVMRTFACLDGVSELVWSPDSEYVLASQLKRKIVQVFCVADPTWICKIDEALAGLTHARWAPDSRHILTRSEFNLRLSIWSLVRKQVTYIKMPKLMPAAPGVPLTEDAAQLGGNGAVQFSHGGTLMAVLSRVECKDVLSIYSVAADPASPTGGWDLLKQFHIDTEDCVQIEWAPNDAHILCIDSSLTYNIAVYTPSGQKLASHRAYEHALGVKGAGQGVKWSPHNSFMAIGSYDQQVRIFNNATWSLVHSYVHSSAAVNGVSTASSASKPKPASNLVLYCEKPLHPSHPVSRLAAETDKENNPLDETTAFGVDVSFAQQSEEGDTTARSMRGASGASSSAAGGLKKKPGVAVGAGAKPKLGVAGRPGSGLASKSKAGSSAASSSSSALSARRPSASSGAEIEKATISVPSKYSIESLPVKLPSIEPAFDKADPKLGVGLVSWSHNERYLLTRNDNMPSVLWVWDTQKLGLSALLVQLEAVRAAVWDPVRVRFAVATATSKLYLWSPEGCSIVDIPLAPGQTFNVRKIEWSRDGKCLLLMDKSKFVCCYMRD